MAAGAPRRSSGDLPPRVAELRALLEAERVRTQARIDALTRDFEQIVAEVAIGSTDDEHDPEGATTAFERAQILSLREQARAQLVELDEARRRLDAGAYGTCEACGEPIPAERLRARPMARRCVGCS